MRLLVILFLVFFVAIGVVLGALNADLVGYDLAFFHVWLPKGAALLGALAVGWLLGGLTAWLGTRARFRKATRQKILDDKKLPAAS